MSEMIDLKKERNFFETRVIEYQSGGAFPGTEGRMADALSTAQDPIW